MYFGPSSKIMFKYMLRKTLNSHKYSLHFKLVVILTLLRAKISLSLTSIFLEIQQFNNARGEWEHKSYTIKVNF
jgi:hypothetical protein